MMLQQPDCKACITTAQLRSLIIMLRLLMLCTAACCVQRNAQFKHYGKDNFTLNVPEFTAAPGELVAVVGRVGAGKSSLIHAILGNMQPVSGHAEAGGRVSYVPQNPWCQNLSLRENILFGLPFDEEKYTRVSTADVRVSCDISHSQLTANSPPQQQHGTYRLTLCGVALVTVSRPEAEHY